MNRMCSKIHIFAGPSLPPAERPCDAHFVYHGPVFQGEVFRLVDSEACAIAIIDGYFERVPAVWHKEILWALCQGVHVFGAASMGALRAAELHQFGMRGIGRIFEDYRDGNLVDDDEVTLVHGDEGEEFRPLSEAMVNVRATLENLEQTHVISSSTREILVKYVKNCYYPDRNYADLVGWAKGKVPEVERAALRDAVYRPTGRIDRKREDAHLLLSVLREFLEERPPPLCVPWHFHHTDAWETVRRRALHRTDS